MNRNPVASTKTLDQKTERNVSPCHFERLLARNQQWPIFQLFDPIN